MVGGAAFVFGRTSRAGRRAAVPQDERGLVGVAVGAGEEVESTEMVLFEGGRRRVDTRMIRVLERDELQGEFATRLLRSTRWGQCAHDEWTQACEATDR